MKQIALTLLGVLCCSPGHAESISPAPYEIIGPLGAGGMGEAANNECP